VLLAVLALLAGVVPAASYTAADVPRGSDVAVTDDQNAVVGLDKNNVTRKQFDPLVNVTNGFDDGATVSVALANPGGLKNTTLYVDTNGDGNYEKSGGAVTFPVDSGVEQTVVLFTEETKNTQIGYDVSVDAGGVSGSLTRSTLVQNSGNNGNGNGGNGGGNCNENGNCG
jgi:hypothetical protein